MLLCSHVLSIFLLAPLMSNKKQNKAIKLFSEVQAFYYYFEFFKVQINKYLPCLVQRKFQQFREQFH
jgi:hypothetical protein